MWSKKQKRYILRCIAFQSILLKLYAMFYIFTYSFLYLSNSFLRSAFLVVFFYAFKLDISLSLQMTQPEWFLAARMVLQTTSMQTTYQ